MNLSSLIFIFAGVFSSLQAWLVYLFGFDLLSGFCFGLYFFLFIFGLRLRIDEKRDSQNPLG